MARWHHNETPTFELHDKDPYCNAYTHNNSLHSQLTDTIPLYGVILTHQYKHVGSQYKQKHREVSVQ